MFSASIIRIEPGWLGMILSPRGLLSITLPLKTKGAAERAIINRSRHLPGEWCENPSPFKPYKEAIRGYFKGTIKRFSLPLDLENATDFERAVWKTTCAIPYSETRSYGWVASMIRRPEAVRAVGNALGRNPLPIFIPCHRVVRSNGSLGGFGAGLDWKQRLLELEARFSGK